MHRKVKSLIHHLRTISIILFGIVGCIALALLFRSFVQSGFYSAFDVDEIYHAQRIYFVLQGYRPFIDYYTSYTPLFHWFVSPVFYIFGYHVESIQYVRVFLFIVFIARIILGILFLRLYVKRWTVFLLLPLVLIDPFEVYTAMQVRPDNLMMFFYMAGFIFLSYGWIYRKRFLIFLSGVFCTISFLILQKIVISIIPLGIVFCIYEIRKRKFDTIKFFLGGILTTLFIFFILFQSSLKPMIQQVFIDTYSYNAANLYIKPGMFYLPDNAEFFGLPGRPLQWLYVNMLPFIGYIGSALILYRIYLAKKITVSALPLIILIASLVSHTIFIYSIPAPYIQYYIPLHWYYVLIATLFLDSILHVLSRYTKLSLLFWIFILPFSYLLITQSIQGNYRRPSFVGGYGPGKYTSLSAGFDTIPQNTSVFPGFLFRKLSNPLDYFLLTTPQFIRSRYPSNLSLIQTGSVDYIIVDDFNTQFYDSAFMSYLRMHYQPVRPNSSIWKKI